MQKIQMCHWEPRSDQFPLPMNLVLPEKVRGSTTESITLNQEVCRQALTWTWGQATSLA